MTKPKLSIIVPAHNEENHIEDTLKSIQDQTFQDLELIVVANACTDNTAEIARRYTPNVYELGEKGVANARNFGASKAQAENLCFIDADTTMNKDLTQKAYEALRKARIEGQDANPYRKLFWFADNSVDRVMFYTLGIPNICSYTPFVFCRKDAFEKVGGFDTDVVATEEIRLLRNLRKLGKIKFINNSHVETSNRRAENQGEIYGGILVPLYHFFFPESKRLPYTDTR